MENRYMKLRALFILVFTFSMTFGQQGHSPWTQITKNSVAQERVLPQESVPVKATYYQLDINALNSVLQKVPVQTPSKSDVVLDFPNADGTMEVYNITEYSVMAPELQAKFPQIRSYVGYSLKNASTVIYFSVSPDGLHSMKLSSDRGTEFVNPYATDSSYKAFSRQDIPTTQNLFECGFVEDPLFNRNSWDLGNAVQNANDGVRRTYRLAVGTSVEYTNFHGGTVASALAAINTTMTRVNGIYDRELSIRMTLVANNDLLISTTGNSLFSNSENISANTGIINSLIGNASYDIGHSFTTGSGGKAQLNSVCTNSKGAGTTGLSTPSGDPFAIDYVAHEIGHQFGATHTFNGTAGNCAGNNRTSASAYEPGSGSTIMSYAGICGFQNIQNNSNDYFHQISLQQIWSNITTGDSTCAVVTATGNTAPTANAGTSYTIPISTPFKLSGSSTDADGIAQHTYTWEQFDLGPATGIPSSTTEFGPMVRSLQGTNSAVRYIPKLEDVVANGGTSSTWEKLPSVERDLNFVLTVRDNDPRGGQTAVDAMTVSAVASAGPFVVTSQTSNVTWEVGSKKNVTWDVANTNVAPINASTVNIKLSIDGGLTFAHTLASNVPNNGTYEIIVPTGTATNKARIMVESVGNIFYNVNTSDFSIIDVDFLLNFSPSSAIACQPNDAVYNFVYNTYQGFTGTTVFSATDLPSGTEATFHPTSAITDGTHVTMTISNLGNVALGSYSITAMGTSGTIHNSSTVLLDVFNGTIAPIALMAPENGAAGLFSEVTFTWEDDINVVDYLIEISTDSHFNTILDSHTTKTTSYATTLAPSTVYYWRVKGFNPCSAGTTSLVRSFSTGVPTCDYLFTATDTPITIDSQGSSVYTSIISVTENLPVVDVNVKVNIAHTMVNNLRLVLISPSGTSIVLAERLGIFFDENYTNTIFDQEADSSINLAEAPFTGSFSPEGDLSAIYGEMSAGDWKLQVTDLVNGNGGSINEFTLQFCLAKPLPLDGNSFETLHIFPNPNNGAFTVKFQSQSGEDIKIGIYDIRGRRMFEKSFINTINFREDIRLQNVPSGMYFVTITDGGKKVTKKIIVN